MTTRKPSLFFFVLIIGLFLASTVAANAAVETAHALRIIVNSQPPVSLDPIMHYNTGINSLLRQIYGTLIEKTPDGRLIPSLATSWRQVQPHVWEITLRNGVLFQNGAELTAEDVIFSLNRLIDPTVKSPRRSNFASIEKIVPDTKYKFKIITKKPDLLIPEKLFVFGGVVSAEEFKRRGEAHYFQHPIGAGPFRFYSLSPSEIILKAFPGYWEGTPKVGTVAFFFLLEPEQAIEKLLAGQADVVTDVPHRLAAGLTNSGQVDLVSHCTSQVFEIFFNALPGAVLNNKKLRQALNYLTPINQLIKEVDPDCRIRPGGDRPFGRRLATFTTPFESGFDPSLIPYQYDQDKGKQLLDESGVTRPLAINLLALNIFEKEAQIVAEAWKEFGLEAKIAFMDRERAFRKVLLDRDPNYPFDAMLTNPVNHWGDVSFLMELHIDPKHPVCRYENPEAYELLNQAAVTVDSQERLKLIRSLQHVVYENPPAVFGYQYVHLIGLSHRVHGFKPYADLYLRLNNIELKDATK